MRLVLERDPEVGGIDQILEPAAARRREEVDERFRGDVPVELPELLDPCATFNTSSAVRSESFPTRTVCGGILNFPAFNGRIV